MMRDISGLIRSNIASLVPYSSARDEYTGSAAVFLDANENPYNHPYNRYPDPHQGALKEKIGRLKDVAPERLFIGNGSDEAIDILFRIFCTPGVDNVVSIDPTYGMYQVSADINDVSLRKVPLTPSFGLDLPALVAACDERTKMLFICSPNNPTSNSFDPGEILQLAGQLELMVIVDEAYIDFSEHESLVKHVAAFPNLVVLQTFSKAWALAGIRLGIAIADPEVTRYMAMVKYPYNVNLLTQQFALEALDNPERVQEWVSVILEERGKLEQQLKQYSFVEHVYPSDANFLLVKVGKPAKVYNYLVEKKIIVRDRSNIRLCEGSLRITVGTDKENKALTEALTNYQRDFIDSCNL